MTDTLSTAAFESRVRRLRHLTANIGDYHKGPVNDAMNMARCFVGNGGDGKEAEHFLLLAEVRAGAITPEQFREADPLGP